jgi:nitrogen fixation/metabolism regulation signal transduction histidine kinase
MKKRKTYLIDKKLQLKAAFYVIALTAVFSIIIMAAISASIVYNNEKINNINEIENNIFQLMQDSVVTPIAGNEFVNISELLVKNHERNLKNIKSLTDYNRILLITLLICVVLQGILLFVLIVRLTHRISGPILVMSNYMKEIIEGKMPNPRPLRDKDELKEFYDLFREMVDSLKKRNM